MGERRKKEGDGRGRKEDQEKGEREGLVLPRS